MAEERPQVAIPFIHPRPKTTQSRYEGGLGRTCAIHRRLKANTQPLPKLGRKNEHWLYTSRLEQFVSPQRIYEGDQGEPLSGGGHSISAMNDLIFPGQAGERLRAKMLIDLNS